MNRSELIRQTAKRTRVTQEKAGEILEAALSVAAEALEAGEVVRLKGFGSLEPRHRKAGTARNFQTGESIPGRSRTVLSFIPSKELRARVNKTEEAVEPSSTNSGLLKAKIADRGASLTELMKASGIKTKKMMEAKINGEKEFTLSEIEGIESILKLSREEVYDIFFPEEV